jgi:hypothetical protein
MVNNGVIAFQQNQFLLINSYGDEMRQPDLLCKTCNGSQIDLSGMKQTIGSVMEEIRLARPRPSFLFDQRPVTLDTVLRRVAYLFWRGDVYDSDIVLIGDDDLTSVAIALTGAAKRVTVFDIDRRLIDFIERTAIHQNLRIEVNHFDISDRLPREYCSQYDVFITDPSPMKIPFTVFLNFGINLLKPSGVGYISFQSSAMEPSIEFQNIIVQSSLLITDLVPLFTEYQPMTDAFTGEDKELLRLYNRSEEPIAFYESYCRVQKTKDTMPHPIKYTLGEMFGRATQMVLSKPALDPARSANGDIHYLDSEYSRAVANQSRKLCSK